MSTAADDALRLMDRVIRLKQENDQLSAELERVSKVAKSMVDALDSTACLCSAIEALPFISDDIRNAAKERSAKARTALSDAKSKGLI